MALRSESEYLKIVSIKIRIFATSFRQSWASLKIYDHISWLRKSFVGFSRENVISGIFQNEVLKVLNFWVWKFNIHCFFNVKMWLVYSIRYRTVCYKSPGTNYHTILRKKYMVIITYKISIKNVIFTTTWSITFGLLTTGFRENYNFRYFIVFHFEYN